MPRKSFSPNTNSSRRDVLRAMLGASVAMTWGCSQQATSPMQGEIVGANQAAGHWLRGDQRPKVVAENYESVGTVIVGGGVAGLAAARRLKQRGHDDFILLELEAQPGGTARSDSNAVSAFPWGAHYLPAPQRENEPLVKLLAELGAIESFTSDGEPIYAEHHLCREPEERLFIDGAWHEDLISASTASAADWAEWQRLLAEMDRWAAWRDAQGRRAFTLPISQGSDDAEVTALDRITMADWLDRQQFRSPRVRWVVDYACRDDYGTTIEHTSAWAGLFYFVARLPKPGAAAQPLLTWPAGNGRLIQHLYEQVRERVQLGVATLEIVPNAKGETSHVAVLAVDVGTKQPRAYQAQRVIYCAPQFTAPYVIRGYREARGELARQFEYGSWLVANLQLRDRPREPGFPLAWDNVLYDSPSLGYVVATHQRGRDQGPTVLTYYYPLCDENPRTARERLLGLDWQACADITLGDLQRAHPDLPHLVERLDVMRWGHAMIRPRTGFQFGPARRACAEPFQGVHFAHSDLSGIALFEEAFDQGLRAADEVLRAQASKS